MFTRHVKQFAVRSIQLRKFTRKSIDVPITSNVTQSVNNLRDKKFICTKIMLNNLEKETDNNDIAKHALGKAKRRLQISFTCKKCNTRNHKTFSKQAYEEGIVIIRCDGCKNNHLIADNLGWFTDYPREKVNIEYLLKLKGENVRKVLNDVEGYCEILKDESSANSQEPNEK